MSVRGDTARGDAARGDAARGDAARGDAARGDAARGDAVRGEGVAAQSNADQRDQHVQGGDNAPKGKKKKAVAKRKPMRWSRKQTKALIEWRTTHDAKFHPARGPGVKKGFVGDAWACVAGDLQRTLCVNVTTKQCSDKWDALQKLYRSALAKKNSTGASADINFEFFDEMHELLHSDPQFATRPLDTGEGTLPATATAAVDATEADAEAEAETPAMFVLPYRVANVTLHTKATVRKSKFITELR
eukprot:TRINITY_DN5095_c0_g1_i2.p1 TRINITY_DN5095_c0_g1~~TRINITY_DN5095_c0_g1_i2.p1  ORF type:complete len:245 (-),score=37.83 TRINITY_DN5095_c0_g1_i2:23-757(-)